jgi:hypothetical protein
MSAPTPAATAAPPADALDHRLAQRRALIEQMQGVVRWLLAYDARHVASLGSRRQRSAARPRK